MTRGALTEQAVRQLMRTHKRTALRKDRRDGSVRGLVLRGSTWNFIFVSPENGKRRRHTIGIVDMDTPDGESSFDLIQARAIAGKLRVMIRTGRDPIEEKRKTDAEAAAQRAKQAKEDAIADERTFGAVARVYSTETLTAKRRGHEERRIIERELLPLWDAKAIDRIAKDDVRDRVRALKAAGKPEAARKLYEVIRQIFNWAEDKYDLKQTPVAQLKPKKLLGKKNIRTLTLTEDELRALWRAAGRAGHPIKPLVQLLSLTGLRRGEVAGARWCEFNLKARQWVIPSERMKADAPHVVPLTDEMIAILETIPRVNGSDLLFPTNNGRPISGFSKLKRRLDALMLEELRCMAEERGDSNSSTTVALRDWVFHDIRRSVRTGLSALRVPNLVCELILAHARPGLHKVYDQHKYNAEKLDALSAWEARLLEIVGAPTPNVIKLRA